MIINGKEVEIEELKDFFPKQNNELKMRKNKLLLRDSHIEVLRRYNIDYENYPSLKSLLYDIDDILEEENDEELEQVADEIQEIIYYYYTNK